MDLADDLDAALDALRRVGTRWGTASDDELLADGQGWEALGRLIDARRVAFAGEIETRSSAKGEGLRLPARFGLRDGIDLVTHVARVSRREAAGRVGLGANLAPHRSLLGEDVPGRLPVLADAVAEGRVGLASARVIADLVRSVRKRADADDLAAAERDLAELAAGADAEAIRQAAEAWALALDPDGPGERQRRRARELRLGRQDLRGGSTFSGYAPAEERATLVAALAAERKNLAMKRSPAGDKSYDGAGPEWRELDGERRTARQIDFDTAFGLITAGIRASAADSASSGVVKAVPEVIVTTTLSDLESRAGTGTITTTGARLPIEAVERLTCGSDLRLQVNHDDGEPLWLGHPARYFSPAQRRTLIASSGGCRWPGCTAPPIWCDVHHVAWYRRDDGPTDVDNGVLLCSFHHHLVHDPATRWRIVMHERQPHLVPRAWTGPPDPAHRMRRRDEGPGAPPPDDDPWGRPLRR